MKLSVTEASSALGELKHFLSRVKVRLISSAKRELPSCLTHCLANVIAPHPNEKREGGAEHRMEERQETFSSVLGCGNGHFVS